MHHLDVSFDVSRSLTGAGCRIDSRARRVQLTSCGERTTRRSNRSRQVIKPSQWPQNVRGSRAQPTTVASLLTRAINDGPERCQWNADQIFLADAAMAIHLSDDLQGAMQGRKLQLDSGEGAQGTAPSSRRDIQRPCEPPIGRALALIRIRVRAQTDFLLKRCHL